MATAQVLKATHTVDDRVRGVDGRVLDVSNRVAAVDDKVVSVDNRVEGVEVRVASVDDNVKAVDDKVAVVIDGAQSYSISHQEIMLTLMYLEGKQARVVIQQTAIVIDEVKRSSCPYLHRHCFCACRLTHPYREPNTRGASKMALAARSVY